MWCVLRALPPPIAAAELTGLGISTTPRQTVKGVTYQIRDEEIVLPDDPRGEAKIDPLGNLLGGMRLVSLSVRRDFDSDTPSNVPKADNGKYTPSPLRSDRTRTESTSSRSTPRAPPASATRSTSSAGTP